MRLRLAAIGLLVAAACSRQGAEPEAVRDFELPPAADAPDFPRDAEGFLQALLPSPHGAVRIVYDVSGPAGMTGTLRVTSRPGGLRHEAWAIQVPLPSSDGDEEAPESKTVEGSRIVTPDVVWTDAVDGAAVVHRAPLGSLARAYADLDPGLQSLVAYRVADWRAHLSQGRVEHPGETETMLGYTCLLTRVASHRVCVWEDTGLTLSYAGDAFRIVATEIETELDVDDSLFEIPEGGQRAVDDQAAVDGHEAIVRLAAGDYADLAAWLRPSLQLGSS
jgi:hypothetical protein